MKRPLWPLPVWLRRTAIGITAVLVFGWSSASAYLYLQQRNIIYLPTRDWAKTPQDFGVNFEAFQLEVKRADGLRESISTWWLPFAASIAFISISMASFLKLISKKCCAASK